MKHQVVNLLTGFLCLSFVVVIWGTNWLVIKDALQSSPPLFFTGIRLLGGAIAIGAARLCLGYPLRLGCDGKGRLVAVGLLQTAGGLGLSLVGLQYLDVGTSALIFYTMPLWLAAIEWTIKEHDPIAGGSIYHLADRMDAGAIAAQEWCFVKKGETARELWERALAPIGLKLMRQVIRDAKERGSLPAMPQDDQFATLAPQIEEPASAH